MNDHDRALNDDARSGTPQSTPIILPAGVGNVLGPVAFQKEGRLVGTYEFRRRTLCLEVPDDGSVLFPTDVGFSLLEALNAEASFSFAGKRVLDVGCGSGLYTVATLVADAAAVAALDVNPASLEATMKNVVGNGFSASRVEPILSDLAHLSVSDQWDIVTCNPPHLPFVAGSAPGDGIQTALFGGSDGRSLYDLLLARLDELLAPGGVLLLAHSSLADIRRTTDELARAGYACRTLQSWELDVPFLRFRERREVIFARLLELRRQGRATFTGLRFQVHALRASRSGEAK